MTVESSCIMDQTMLLTFFNRDSIIHKKIPVTGVHSDSLILQGCYGFIEVHLSSTASISAKQWLDSLAQRCASAHCRHHATVNEKKDECAPPLTVLIGPGTGGLFFVPLS